ncbi:hypothetical protein CVT24_006814 [Panaeolus cyanescens]|uniref:G domain-containing protein n=1 Tax=Panaeolus cyanescens TaxID=181874 RepID=A0A409VBH2_9AGAR|nr:hypothetical protein CVT24_006814 [Panaeolus cyanescens]
MPLLTLRSFGNSQPSLSTVLPSEHQRVVPAISATLPNGDVVSSDDVIIALMGPTGSGKSTFLNTATGASVAIGKDLSSCTSSIVPIRIPLPSDPSRNLILVDTPGFDNSKFSDVGVMKMIAEWLKQTFQQKILLSGIFYFHKISDNRLAGTPLANMRIFEELCGRSAFANVMLITTMWDEVDEMTGLRRQTELCSKFWKKMIQAGSKIQRSMQTPESASSLLNPFLNSCNQRCLLLQDEMVNQKLLLPRTSAGRALAIKLGEEGQRQASMLSQIRQELETGGLDPKSARSLEFDYQKLQNRSDETLVESREFKVPLSALVSDIVRYPFKHHSRVAATLLLHQFQQKKLTSDHILDIRRHIRNNERDPDLVIFVLGPTGSGKSSFINAVVGRRATPVEEDGGLSSVTDRVHTALHPNTHGNYKHATNICFVDVPAFNHSAPAVKDALPAQIRNWLDINVLGKKVDSAIIYMNSLGSNRLNEPFSDHLDDFVDICKDSGHSPIVALLLQTEVGSDSLADQADEPFNTSVQRFARELLSHDDGIGPSALPRAGSAPCACESRQIVGDEDDDDSSSEVEDDEEGAESGGGLTHLLLGNPNGKKDGNLDDDSEEEAEEDEEYIEEPEEEETKEVVTPIENKKRRIEELADDDDTQESKRVKA